MKTKAVRLYGKDDLRLEEFELGPVGEDDVLCEVVCDSLCMSSYKEASQGAAHKRVPCDIAENPVIVGHEFCGRIVEAGSHAELLERGGLYAALWQRQSGGFIGE